MKALQRAEIVPLGAYAKIRDAYRRAVIAHKRARRVEVGPSVVLIFEDRETLRFQVQEMCFVERLATTAQVQHELDVYNELMPRSRELSATLMVQITEPGRIRAELDKLIGIDEHVALVLGQGPQAQRIQARFDPKQFEAERISAVQYIRFSLDDAQAVHFADPSQAAAFEIDHPAYRHRAELRPEVRASLSDGLESAPPVLLPDWSEHEEAQSDFFFENDVARVVEGERADSLVVESRIALAALDEAGWSALFEALRRASLAVVARCGRARVEAELSADATPRWRVEPAPRPSRSTH